MATGHVKVYKSKSHELRLADKGNIRVLEKKKGIFNVR